MVDVVRVLSGEEEQRKKERKGGGGWRGKRARVGRWVPWWWLYRRRGSWVAWHGRATARLRE